MICVDASIAVKLIVQQEQTDLAKTLYQTALLTRQPLVAPPLLPFEVTNTLRQKMRRQAEITVPEAVALLEEFALLPITIRNPVELHGRALRLATDLGLPAAYDAHYLALAEILDCEFWTADMRLLRQVQNRLTFVRWLGDSSPRDAG
jgi:predicted nucleic acid-binding protein